MRTAPQGPLEQDDEKVRKEGLWPYFRGPSRRCDDRRRPAVTRMDTSTAAGLRRAPFAPAPPDSRAPPGYPASLPSVRMRSPRIAAKTLLAADERRCTPIGRKSRCYPCLSALIGGSNAFCLAPRGSVLSVRGKAFVYPATAICRDFLVTSGAGVTARIPSLSSAFTWSDLAPSGRGGRQPAGLGHEKAVDLAMQDIRQHPRLCLRVHPTCRLIRSGKRVRGALASTAGRSGSCGWGIERHDRSP